jgi:hypothetical protein
MTVAAPSANGARTISRPAPSRLSQRPPSALELIRAADSAEEGAQEAGSAPQAQPFGFSPEQLAALSAPLDRANVRQREQGRSRVSYLEGCPGDRGSEPHLWLRWLAAPDHCRPLSRPGRTIDRCQRHEPGPEAWLGRHLHRPCARHRHRKRSDTPGSGRQRRRPRHRRGSRPGP